MDICKRHFLDYVAESNCSTSISVGDTYTIVAEQSGLSSQCVDCAEDASELIYSETRADGTWYDEDAATVRVHASSTHSTNGYVKVVEEPVPPVEWVSGFTITTGYYNGHVAKAQIQAGSLQEALESTKDFWDDPQFQSMKITRAILRSEEE
jgi:bacterioferritin-associated ferredoxin